MQLSSKRARIFLLHCGFALSSLSLPVALADVSISGLDNIRIDAWAGTTGDLKGSDTYCTLSYSEQCTGPWFNRVCTRTAAHYDVGAYSDGSSDAAGTFYLSHDSSSALLPVIFEWANPVVGTFTMSNWWVTNYTAPPTSPYAPGATQCTDPNAQNTISITVSESTLATAAAGTYSETFRIDMCRLNGGGNTAECSARVAFSVEVPELIQVNRLDNVAFGSWSGAGNMQQVEPFCVFRNGAGGFSLTVSGANADAQQFQLSGGTSDLPYSIEVGNGSSWFTAESGIPLSSSETGFMGVAQRNCGGADSHSLRLSILEADLAAAVASTYTDTVTIYVEPE